MKKSNLIKRSLYFMICSIMFLTAMPFTDLVLPKIELVSASAPELVQERIFRSNATNVEEMTGDLFGDIKINSMEYLYNFDDSADYIYVDFKDAGYAVYLRENLAVLEYSPVGSLPFSYAAERKYYNGPQNYYEKQQDQFVNKISGELTFISATKKTEISDKIRSYLLNNVKSKMINHVQIEDKWSMDSAEGLQDSKITGFSSESIDLGNLTDGYAPGTEGTTYIPNYQYYYIQQTLTNIAGTTYGDNDFDTCGAVAAQMLLNYNNYYIDRRIIPNNFLHPNTDQNPNTVIDPTIMTRWTLGSISTNAGENSYYAQILNIIPGASTNNQVKNAINTMLNNRNQELNGALNFSVTSGERSAWDIIWGNPISSSGIRSEIDDGRPLIIMMQESLGGIDHFVVGYGYHNIGNELGYVTHFGWGRFQSRVWINSAWCHAYVTLNIESHVHDYVQTTNMIGDQYEYVCSICGHRKLDDADLWIQPHFTSNSGTDYTITASSNYTGREPYGAFDGWKGSVSTGNALGYSAAQWTANGTSGWLELNLTEYVSVSKIYFYNRQSSASEYTKEAYFTGTGGVPLGVAFTGKNRDFGLSIIEVEDVVTNVIKLNIISSYGSSYVGASEIIIFATAASAPDSGWEQPVWTSNTSSDGTISASGYYGNEEPWKAYNGTMLGGSGGNGDLWSVNATTGWLQLKLNYYIEVYSIVFNNGVSSSSNRTKTAKFTGSGGMPLGEPFTAPNHDFGYVGVYVGGVVTNVIQLNISSSYGSYVGASKITIYANELETQPDPGWEQPIWTSNTSSDGAITASGAYSNEEPWKAYNGTILGGSGGNGDQWSVNATTGWLQLKLNYYIEVNSIVFYNGVSTASNRTKDAKFTGRGGVPLGEPFTAANHNFSYVFVPVGGVVTNVIQLNISSSYGSYVNASMIIINATELETQPNEETWTQPIWTGYTNDHGKVSASGSYSNELPWKAYNGTMLGGSGGNGDNWSVNATNGWLTLTLDYPVYVTSIEIYGNSSGANNRIKGAYFTGMDGVALGSSFQFANVNQAYQNVSVGGVWTNVIRLNVTSSYGSYIGASMITIHATV